MSKRLFIHPKVISVGAIGNRVLTDKSKSYPEEYWPNGLAQELVDKGFLVWEEEKKEPPKGGKK